MADLNVNDIANAAGTGPVDLYKQQAAKAGFFWDQLTTTANYTLNVSSLTDASTGITDAAVNNNFDVAATQGTSGASGGADGNVSARGYSAGSWTTSGFRYANWDNSLNNWADEQYGGMVHGDLA